MGAEIAPSVLCSTQGGTLVLHAIEKLPEKVRPRLVRALNGIAGEDIRIVATTTDPKIAANEDYRWITDSAVTIQLPALRDRWGDIPDLVGLFLREFRTQTAQKTVSNKTIAALCGCEWPGNVRELRDAVQRAVALSKGNTLTFDSFWPDQDTMMEFLKKAMSAALQRHKSFRRAAEALAIPKSTFADLAARMGLSK